MKVVEPRPIVHARLQHARTRDLHRFHREVKDDIRSNREGDKDLSKRRRFGILAERRAHAVMTTRRADRRDLIIDLTEDMGDIRPLCSGNKLVLSLLA